MDRSVVAIVGRPNVGKSTLFNRIVGQRLAIVEGTPGITRDRLYAKAEWLDQEFWLIDTGGISDVADPFQTQIRQQVQVALAEADLVIMVVDGREPLTTSDHQLATLLRKANKPVVLAVNKIEVFDQQFDPELYKLGLGEPVMVSAEHGRNIGDLLDRVQEQLPPQPPAPLADLVRVAVIGRPNVGKSSLVNALLGEERSIVSAAPGTTRDAIDTELIIDNRHYLLVDTAGIRRRSKVDLPVEYYSVLRAVRAVERCDVALLVLDATSPVTDQDLRVAGIVQEAGKACIIVMNKWDLVTKDDQTTAEFTEDLRHDLEFISYAPILFISAKTGQRLARIMPLVDQVMTSYNLRLSANRLNQLVAEAIATHHPPTGKRGKPLKIYYTNQIRVRPPTFQLTVNDPQGLPASYQRYLERQLRQECDFTGTPLRFSLKVSHKNKP